MPGSTKLQLRDLLLGAYVLLVPTAATIFSDAVQDGPLAIRWILLVSWVVSAVVIVVDQAKRNERSDKTFETVDKLTADTRSRLQQQAEDARDTSIERFLTQDYWFKKKWEWTIYIYDHETELLSPIWPAPETGEQAQLISFAPGKGATGQAWKDGITIVRNGTEVHDATHGLTREQQEHFAKRHAVVATPIYADTQKIGVLAGITNDDNREFDAKKDQSHLARTATIIGTLLTSLNTDP